MSQALNYERFTRIAFGYDPEKHIFNMVARRGDQASLADTDTYNDRNIIKVKSATTYAMFIYINEIYNHSQLIQDDYDAETNRINAIIDDVLKADKIMQIHGLIDVFKDSVVDKYLFANGKGLVLRDHYSE